MQENSSLQRALTYIADDQAQILDDLQRMLAVDTCFPPGLGYAAFADLLSTMLQPMHFDLQRVSVPDALWQTPDGSAQGERVNLLAALDAGAAENCNLYFHTDTVPAGDGWRFPPLALSLA